MVLRQGAERPSDGDLADHVRASLRGRSVPARFVWLDALPRTALGKLARGPLRALLAPAPSPPGG